MTSILPYQAIQFDRAQFYSVLILEIELWVTDKLVYDKTGIITSSEKIS